MKIINVYICSLIHKVLGDILIWSIQKKYWKLTNKIVLYRTKIKFY
jgi:hypothetical protein